MRRFILLCTFCEWHFMKLSENDYTLMSPFQSEQVLANSKGKTYKNRLDSEKQLHLVHNSFPLQNIVNPYKIITNDNKHI